MTQEELEKQRVYREIKKKDPVWIEERRIKQRLYDDKRNKSARKEAARIRRREKVKIDPVFVDKEKVRLASYYLTIEGRHSCIKRELKREQVSVTDPLWNIDFYGELISDGLCHYCSGPLKSSGHGLDRAINNLGHTCYNVVPCCWSCNDLKGERLSYEEMMLLAPALQRIRKQRETVI